MNKIYTQIKNRAIVNCSPVKTLPPLESANILTEIIQKNLSEKAIEELAQRLIYWQNFREWESERPNYLQMACKAYVTVGGKEYLVKKQFRGNRLYWYMWGTYEKSKRYTCQYIGKTLDRKKLEQAHDRFQAA